MSILYHPGKTNGVADALNMFYMDSISHFDEDQKELISKKCSKICRLRVRSMDSNEGRVMVMNGTESSLVSEVKGK